MENFKSLLSDRAPEGTFSEAETERLTYGITTTIAEDLARESNKSIAVALLKNVNNWATAIVSEHADTEDDPRPFIYQLCGYNLPYKKIKWEPNKDFNEGLISLSTLQSRISQLKNGNFDKLEQLFFYYSLINQHLGESPKTAVKFGDFFYARVKEGPTYTVQAYLEKNIPTVNVINNPSNQAPLTAAESPPKHSFKRYQSVAAGVVVIALVTSVVLFKMPYQPLSVDAASSYSQNDLQQLLSQAKHDSEQYPDNIEAQYNYANLLDADSQIDHAKQVYLQVIALAPRHFGSLNNLARLELIHGDPDKALAYFYGLNPNELQQEKERAYFHKNRAWAYLQKQQTLSAETELDKLESLVSNDEGLHVALHCLRAIVNYHLNRPWQSWAQTCQSAALSPKQSLYVEAQWLAQLKQFQ